MAFKPHDKRHRDLQEDVKPPNSRLFVLCSKGIKEETFKEAFEKYGSVEDIWIVKDRRTNEDKGVVYIKYSLASEAALAMEEMNGRVLPGHPKPLKVLVASSKREGSVRDPKEEEKNLRLFVIIPKSYSKEELRKDFEKYGDIDSVMIVSDKHTGENKGFGYVRFHRPYHAALAYENCDASFKPKFADPKGSGPSHHRDRDYYESSFSGYGGGYNDRGGQDHYRGGGGGGGGGSGGSYRDRDRGFKRHHDDMMGGGARDMNIYDSYMSDPGPVGPIGPVGMGGGPMEMLQSYSSQGCTRLHITAPIGLTQGYLTRLFSLIPGLEYCDLNETTGIAYARYTSPQCATYARDKLNNFEYPIGSRLIVRYADDQRPPEMMMGSAPGMDSYGGYVGPRGETGNSDVIQRAAMVLEKAGINPDTILNNNFSQERVPYCSIPLPPPKQMLPEDTEVAQRLFIVCQPSGIPEKILRDAFCRFGCLIDVYLLPARNYGYAKFASKESAMKAIQVLHGQNIAGNRLKVLEAEPPKNDEDEPAKKQRM